MGHHRTPRTTTRAESRSGLCAVAALLILLTGCDPAGPELEPGNVEMLVNAQVVQTDTGVVVNGRRALRFPSNGRALWLDRFDHYEFGGFPEHGYPQDERHSLAWWLMLTHEAPAVERNDSTVLRFHDHGAAAIADTVMDKLTDLPGVTPGSTVGFVNFVRYFLPISTAVEWLGGGVTDFGSVAFHGTMVAGGALTLTTTGSDSVAPITATFSVRPFAPLAGVENGDAVALNRDDMPVLSTGEPLVLEFDGPLDPERAAVIFHPFHGGGATAWVQTAEPADRWVIPGDMLARLTAESDAAQVAYRMFVIEYVVQDSVVTGMFTSGTDFALPFVQRSETTFPFYLASGD